MCNICATKCILPHLFAIFVLVMIWKKVITKFFMKFRYYFVLANKCILCKRNIHLSFYMVYRTKICKRLWSWVRKRVEIIKTKAVRAYFSVMIYITFVLFRKNSWRLLLCLFPLTYETQRPSFPENRMIIKYRNYGVCCYSVIIIALFLWIIVSFWH